MKSAKILRAPLVHEIIGLDYTECGKPFPDFLRIDSNVPGIKIIPNSEMKVAVSERNDEISDSTDRKAINESKTPK